MSDNGLIHVAGVIDNIEAKMLVDCGVEYLGFPLALNYHQEDLSVADATEIVATLGDRVTFFLITYLNRAGDIADLCSTLGVAMVQLHGTVAVEELKRLRASHEHLRVIKSLIVHGDNALSLADEMRIYSPIVDAFITDTFDPITGATGATGKVHDWEISRRLVKYSRKPVILAGGLNADNVRDAIKHVRPAGVDVHTGLEGPEGRKQPSLTKRFVAEARLGFADAA